MGSYLPKLETLRAFVTVVRHGNLRCAAEELGRTQSALSMALGQLEHDLGGPLFVTDRKRELTDLGAYVHDLADGLVRENDRVMGLIRGYAQGDTGHLRIASVPSVAALILPDLIGTFMENHPGAEIALTDGDSASVREMIAGGHADLGIAGGVDAGATPLFRDRLHVVCRSDSPLDGALRWSDLTGQTLILNEALSGVDAPEARKLMAESKLWVRNVLSLFAMIGAGRGITVLPGLATRSLPEGLRAVPLTGNATRRTVSLMSRADRSESPLSQTFRSYLADRLPAFRERLNLEGVG